MSKPERFTNATGAPVPDNTNILTAGRRLAWILRGRPASRGYGVSRAAHVVA